MLVIWVLGSLIISRLRSGSTSARRTSLSFFLFGVVRSLITGAPVRAEIAPITGPMYQLFIFFMITDPKTTVQVEGGQIVVAFLRGVRGVFFRLARTSTRHTTRSSSSGRRRT